MLYVPSTLPSPHVNGVRDQVSTVSTPNQTYRTEPVSQGFFYKPPDYVSIQTLSDR